MPTDSSQTTPLLFIHRISLDTYKHTTSSSVFIYFSVKPKLVCKSGKRRKINQVKYTSVLVDSTHKLLF